MHLPFECRTSWLSLTKLRWKLYHYQYYQRHTLYFHTMSSKNIYASSCVVRAKWMAVQGSEVMCPSKSIEVLSTYRIGLEYFWKEKDTCGSIKMAWVGLPGLFLCQFCGAAESSTVQGGTVRWSCFQLTGARRNSYMEPAMLYVVVKVWMYFPNFFLVAGTESSAVSWS